MNLLDARRRLLGRNVYKRTTEGDPAIAQGSLARRYPGITMQGWTEQPQYEGKNLLNKNSSNWVVGKRLMWGAESGTPIEYSGDGVYAAIILIEGIKPSTKYSFKNLDKSKIWVNRIIFADGLGIGYQNVPLYGIPESHNHEEYSITSANNENITHAYFQVRTLPSSNGENVAITDQDIKDMLVCFSEGEPIYEPYTGGAPSPSPDYPQEIVSAGNWNEETQKWEYEIEVGGANLFIPPNDIVKSGVTYSVGEDGWLTLDGTCTKEDNISDKQISLPSGYCTLSIEVDGDFPSTGNTDIAQIYSTSKADGLLVDKNSRVYADYLEESNDYQIRIHLNNGFAYNNARVRVMLNIGDTALSYEPYRTPQTVTLTSDRPLTKWDKLEKCNRQWGWVYKSAEIVLDGSEDEEWIRTTTNTFTFNIEIPEAKFNPSFCNRYRWKEAVWVSSDYGVYSDNGYATKYFRPPSLEIETVEQWREWLSENSLIILCGTVEETFVPLSETEQEQMNELYTFRPTTVLSNDCECEMTLTYKTKKSLEVTT